MGLDPRSTQELWNRAPVGLFRTSLDGEILAVNEMGARFLGYEHPRELVGRNVEELYERPEQRGQLLETLAQRGSVRGFSVALKRADGTVGLYAVDVRRVDAGPDQVVLEGAIYWVASDPGAVQTLQAGLERHEALNRFMIQALRSRNAEEVARRLVEFAGSRTEADWCGLVCRELSGGVVSAGKVPDVPRPSWERCPVHEVSWEDLADSPAGEDAELRGWCERAGFRALLVLPGDTEYIGCCCLVAASRAPRSWEEETLRFLRTLMMHAAAVLDRHAVEARYRRQSQLLEEVLEAAPVGILVLDQGGGVVVANRIARTYLEILAPGWEGEKNGPGAVRQLAGMSLEEVLARKPHVLETRGRTFAVEHTAMGEELPGGVLLTIRDLTPEIRIRERAEAQERLAAVGRLAAGIAHDFNNILTSVLGYSELALKTGGLPPVVRENLEIVVEQAHRGAKLIRQVLDFGRRSRLSLRQVDLEDFLRQHLSVWRRTLPETVELKVEVDPAGRPYAASVDPSSMDQVLVNLVLNAVDAMDGRGRCLIRLGRSMVSADESGDVPPGQWLVISVEDSGPGIPESLRDRIFEPFFTTKQPGAGTGLGLSQAYGIVKQHRGCLTAGHSEQLGGAAMQIYLPCPQPDEAQDEESGPKTAAPRGRGEHILAVEDDGHALRALERILTDLGYRVTAFSDPEMALEAFSESPGSFDLVITDVVMPKLSGPDLVRAMARVHPGVRTILVSGYPVGMSSFQLRHERVFEQLSKPYSVEALGLAIRRALDGVR